MKSVRSLGKGVYGESGSGESITQLLRCERIRFAFDDMTVVDIWWQTLPAQRSDEDKENVLDRHLGRTTNL